MAARDFNWIYCAKETEIHLNLGVFLYFKINFEFHSAIYRKIIDIFHKIRIQI